MESIPDSILNWRPTMRDSANSRLGGVLPMTFVVMIIASLMTMQVMKNMILQHRNTVSRFRTQQALEWIALGKLRIAVQQDLHADYKGEVLLIENFANDDSSVGARPGIIIARRSKDKELDECETHEWEINVVLMNDKENAIANWQGKL